MANHFHSSKSLTLGRLIVASLLRYWRVSLAVAFGVATATAVITGALLVGDSMRGSLAELTIERLGRTDSMVAPMAFFHADGIADAEVNTTPLIFFPTAVAEAKGESKSGGRRWVRRAGSIQIIGIDDGFWELDSLGIKPAKAPNDDGVVLNAAAAAELDVQPGDLITLRLPSQQAVPADSPLGRRDQQSEGLPRMEVLDVIQDRGLGRFSLSPSQAAPQNVYVSRKVIGDVLDREGQANLLLFDQPVGEDELSVGLDDLGLSLRRITRKFEGQTIVDYFTVTSDRLLLPELVVDQVREELEPDNALPVTTYLANAIERLDENGVVAASVSYSTITAIDSTAELPLDYTKPNQTDPSILPLVINDWTAKQLDADEGSRLRIAYYEPEVENGKEIERYVEAVVTDIVPVTEPKRPYRRNRDPVFDQPPTVYNDPDLTPLVPGVTDQDSISDWDLPFQLQREISKDDDAYWNNHRLTPKAFLPLADGRHLFGSRFGQTTSLRIDATVSDDLPALTSRIEKRLKPHLSDLGWAVLPIRSRQLAASRGTTQFDGLFLALGFFVIAAAVLLIAMLFRLGLTERTKQMGTLMSVGWAPSRVVRMMLAEGLVVASIGTTIGVIGGVLYAWAVLWAFRTTWVGAITVPFLNFHWTATSVIVGAVGGWLAAAITLVITTRWLLRVSARELLSGRDLDRNETGWVSGKPKKSKLPLLAGAVAVLAFVCGIFGAVSGGQAAVGGFIGGGILLMFTVLLMVYHRLRRPRRVKSGDNHYSIGSMAARNASRRPLRSTMTIGLMAMASFLIVAISAFRLQPGEAGTGGFDLIAQSAQPFFLDLRDGDVRSETFGPDADDLDGVTIAAMRLRLGQDASCNNLYQATQPTVLGVPDGFSGQSAVSETNTGFDWASHATTDDGQSPWTLLDQHAKGTADDPVPVVIDQNTAMWSLQMTGGIGQVKSFEYEAGKPIFFRVVGLLSNSILQGRLMVGEANFEKMFPDISGYQFFMIDAPNTDSSIVAETLESRLGDIGMDVSNAKEVLAGMLTVQNTYLRTFQSLGAIGLLLGTIGLAVAQIRSVIERRSELAVMRAIGFTRRRLATVVMAETASLLLTGIGCGVLCAVLVVLPHSWFSGIRPPIVEPLVIVLLIMAFGFVAGVFATFRVSRLPLMNSLRSE